MLKKTSLLPFLLWLGVSLGHATNLSYKKFISDFDVPLKTFIERAFTATFSNLDSMQVAPIEGGFSSAKIYKVMDGDKSYVLRILPTKFAIERRMAEHQGHKIAASLGVAPKVIYAGPESHVMIMDYIDGRALTVQDMKNTKILKKIADNLRKIHDYKLPFPFAQTQKKRAVRQKTKADKAHAVYPKGYQKLYDHYMKTHRDGPGTDWVFGHGDLNPTNMLLTKEGGLYFIDWPNAAMENRYIELGSLTFWAGMDASSIKTFLTHYFGTSPTQAQLKDLSWGQRRAAFYVATMWLRFVDPGAYEYTMSLRQREIDKRFHEKLRDIRDYHRKGEVVSIAAGAKGQGLKALLTRQRQKRMDYGLANLQAYRDWEG